MAASGVSPEAGVMTYLRPVKSMPPKRMPMTGMTTSLTRELTMAVNAPPMMTPTARSMTLPREMNCLNSAQKLFACFICVLPLRRRTVWVRAAFGYYSGFFVKIQSASQQQTHGKAQDAAQGRRYRHGQQGPPPAAGHDGTYGPGRHPVLCRGSAAVKPIVF